MSPVALGVPDVNHNACAPSIFKFIHLKVLLHAPLQHLFDRHLKSRICKRASMGISFEAITFDSNLQWDLE